MRFEFKDGALQRLYLDPDYRQKRLGAELVRAFRKKVGLIAAVADEQELRQHKALHLERLRGDREGQSSVRLNGQWRLILEFVTDESGRLAAIIEIVDYH